MVAHFNNIKDVIIQEIQAAKENIKIAVAWFTNYYLLDALIAKCKEGVKIELVIVYDSINFKVCGLDFNQLKEAGGVLFLADADGKMHHKFCIIDNQVLINGSYNWTYWAENRNSENIVVTKNSVDLIQEFCKEFEKVKQKATIAENINYASAPETYKDGFYNIKNIVSDEYLQNIVVLNKVGKKEEAWKTIEQLNKFYPTKVSEYLLNNSAEKLQLYSEISTNTTEYLSSDYAILFDDARKNFYKQNYVDAFKAANWCASLFPDKPSIFILRGDMKMQLGDKNGAYKDYGFAVRNLLRTKGNNRILYYGNKKYIDVLFPLADLALRFNNLEAVKKILKHAEEEYSLKKDTKKWAIRAKQYLQQIEKGEAISQID